MLAFIGFIIFGFILGIIINTYTIYYASIIIGEKINIQLSAIIGIIFGIISISLSGLIGSIIAMIISILVLIKIGQFSLISSILVIFIASAINFGFFLIVDKIFG